MVGHEAQAGFSCHEFPGHWGQAAPWWDRQKHGQRVPSSVFGHGKSQG